MLLSHWFPLGILLANTFLDYDERNWLDSFPFEYRPLYYQRYIHDIFALFKSSDLLKRLQSCLNYCHVNMSFPIKTGQNNKRSFLDVNAFCEQDKVITNNRNRYFHIDGGTSTEQILALSATVQSDNEG